MMKTEKALITCATFAVLLALTACGNQKSAATKKSGAPVSQPAASAQQPAAQPAEIKVEKEVYVYDPKGRRDPFATLVEVKTATKKPRKDATPIESFEVEEIKLIAIAWDQQRSYAMVTLPDKKSFTIRKGMTIGLSGGKIVEITRDSVLITEQVKDYNGQIKTKDTIMKLRKEEE